MLSPTIPPFDYQSIECGGGAANFDDLCEHFRTEIRTDVPGGFAPQRSRSVGAAVFQSLRGSHPRSAVLAKPPRNYHRMGTARIFQSIVIHRCDPKAVAQHIAEDIHFRIMDSVRNPRTNKRTNGTNGTNGQTSRTFHRPHTYLVSCRVAST